MVLATTEHAGRLGDVLVYSHPRIGMTGSCIIAVNFIIPWILLFIFTQNNGNHSLLPKEQGINATGATNPADRRPPQWLPPPQRPAHPRTVAHTCCAGCRTNGHVTREPRGAPPSSPPPDHQRDRAPGPPAARPPGAARHVLGPPCSGLQAKKSARKRLATLHSLAGWFRSAAATATDAGLSIAVAVVSTGHDASGNDGLTGGPRAVRRAGTQHHDGWRPRTPPLTTPGSGDDEGNPPLLHMQEWIANHVAPHAALLFFINHQRFICWMLLGLREIFSLPAYVRACVVGCAPSQYMRSPLGYRLPGDPGNTAHLSFFRRSMSLAFEVNADVAMCGLGTMGETTCMVDLDSEKSTKTNYFFEVNTKTNYSCTYLQSTYTA